MHLLVLVVSPALLLALTASGQPLSIHAERRPCVRCEPGEGVVSVCNSTHQTECSPCSAGTWSPRHPHSKKCMSCALCGQALYVERKCTATHDTHCGACASLRGRITLDFILKCLDQPSVFDEDGGLALRAFRAERRLAHQKRLPDDGSKHHEFWRDSVAPPPSLRHTLLKPTYHEYRMRLAQTNRHLALSFLGLTGAALLVTLAVAAAFLRRRYSNSGLFPPTDRLYMQLSDSDQQLIHDCAARLEGGKAFGPTPADDWWEDPAAWSVTTNPLEEYLDASPSTDWRSARNANGTG